MAPGGEMSDIHSISAITYCPTGAMNGSPTVRTQCVRNRQTPICRYAVLGGAVESLLLEVVADAKQEGAQLVLFLGRKAVKSDGRAFAHIHIDDLHELFALFG